MRRPSPRRRRPAPSCRWSPAAIAFVLVLVPAACGGDGDGGTLTEVPTAAPFVADAGAPTPTGDAQPTSEPTRDPAPTVAPTGEARSTPEAQPTAEPTPDPDAPAPIEAWQGTYEWLEFASGGPGSDQFIVHQLTLDGLADGSLTGTFVEQGFQTDSTVPVAAYPAETGIIVFTTAANTGLPRYQEDERLFSLQGDPAAPETTLGVVQASLGEVPPTGVYFEPVAEG